MVRALVGGSFLSFSHNHLLSGWIERRPPIRHGLALAPRRPAVVDRFRELQGLVRIQTLRPDYTCHLASGANGIVAFVRIAPWAIEALQVAQYYELDSSFTALDTTRD
jgi:hypothetical protein